MAVQTIVKVELDNGNGNPRRYTCADGVAISKNQLLTLSDPRTAATVSVAPATLGYLTAGISAMDKEASDGSTSITCWTAGIFEMVASGNITVGNPVKSCGSNYVMAAPAADVASGVIIGYALETATANEAINVRVQL